MAQVLLVLDGIGAGFERWKGGRGLRVTDFQVNS
jgi:hypothetical protein